MYYFVDGDDVHSPSLEENKHTNEARGAVIAKAKIKTVKMTFVIVFGKFLNII